MERFIKRIPFGMVLIVILFFCIDTSRLVFPAFAPYAHPIVFLLMVLFMAWFVFRK